MRSLTKCGYCGSTMRIAHRKLRHKREPRKEVIEVGYQCSRSLHQTAIKRETCKGCYIIAETVDTAGWKKAVEIIDNPKQIDDMIASLRSDDPTAQRRRNINKKIKEIQQQQGNFRTQLADVMRKRKPDVGTRQFLLDQLHQLAQSEQEWNEKLAQEEQYYQNWKRVEEKLTKLHERCADMREKLRDPAYTPDYDEKRDLMEFFGIYAVVWRADHKPRCDIRLAPPSIMMHLSR